MSLCEMIERGCSVGDLAVMLKSMRDDGDYVSVPFKPVKKVHVEYCRVGALKPMPYDETENNSCER